MWKLTKAEFYSVQISNHGGQICKNQPPLNSIKFKSAILKLKDMKINHHRIVSGIFW
jgi:hypothetical protein